MLGSKQPTFLLQPVESAIFKHNIKRQVSSDVCLPDASIDLHFSIRGELILDPQTSISYLERDSVNGIAVKRKVTHCELLLRVKNYKISILSHRNGSLRIANVRELG